MNWHKRRSIAAPQLFNDTFQTDKSALKYVYNMTTIQLYGGPLLPEEKCEEKKFSPP